MTKAPLFILAILLTANVASAGSEDTPKGYRKIVVPVSPAVAQGAKAGDHVDVIFAYDKPLTGKAEGRSAAVETIPVAQTILQNALVVRVATGDHAGIELAVTPNDAQWVAWGLAWGKGVFIAVRTPGDQEVRPLESVTPNHFLK